MYADFRLREQVIPLVFVRFPVSVLMPAKFFAKAEDVGRVFFLHHGNQIFRPMLERVVNLFFFLPDFSRVGRWSKLFSATLPSPRINSVITGFPFSTDVLTVERAPFTSIVMKWGLLSLSSCLTITSSPAKNVPLIQRSVFTS